MRRVLLRTRMVAQSHRHQLELERVGYRLLTARVQSQFTSVYSSLTPSYTMPKGEIHHQREIEQ